MVELDTIDRLSSRLTLDKSRNVAVEGRDGVFSTAVPGCLSSALGKVSNCDLFFQCLNFCRRRVFALARRYTKKSFLTFSGEV